MDFYPFKPRFKKLKIPMTIHLIKVEFQNHYHLEETLNYCILRVIASFNHDMVETAITKWNQKMNKNACIQFNCDTIPFKLSIIEWKVIQNRINCALFVNQVNLPNDRILKIKYAFFFFLFFSFWYRWIYVNRILVVRTRNVLITVPTSAASAFPASTQHCVPKWVP